MSPGYFTNGILWRVLQVKSKAISNPLNAARIRVIDQYPLKYLFSIVKRSFNKSLNDVQHFNTLLYESLSKPLSTGCVVERCSISFQSVTNLIDFQWIYLSKIWTSSWSREQVIDIFNSSMNSSLSKRIPLAFIWYQFSFIHGDIKNACEVLIEYYNKYFDVFC